MAGGDIGGGGDPEDQSVPPVYAFSCSINLTSVFTVRRN